MNKKSLLTLFPALLGTVFLSSCVSLPPVPGLPCDEDVRGSNKITYGITNSKTILQVKETVRVEEGKGLVFKLDPRGGKVPRIADFKDAKVSIRGKSGSGWITLIEGSYNSTKDSKHRIAICANTAPGRRVSRA